MTERKPEPDAGAERDAAARDGDVANDGDAAKDGDAAGREPTGSPARESGGKDGPAEGDLASDERFDPDSTAEGLRKISLHGDLRNSGVSVLGDGAVIYLGTPASGRGPRVWTEEIAATVTRMAEAYAPSGSDDELDQRLHDGRLVYLAGPAGSGRYTAGCMALVRRRAVDRVAGVGFAPDAGLTELFDEPECFVEGYGHILQPPANQRPDPMTLVRLEAMAHERDASVILLGEAGPGRDLTEYMVRYRRPEVEAVFRAQLTYRLRDRGKCVARCVDCDGGCVPLYVAECVRLADFATQLAGGVNVADAVEWATEIVSSGAPAGDELAALLAGLLPTPLDEARRILAVEHDTTVLDGDTGTSTEYRRAFRVAYAAFNGLPLGRVFEAADRLAGGGEADGPLARPRLDVRALLGDVMSNQVAVADEDQNGQPRSASLKSPNLVSAILDVAWHDWGLSARLLSWLDGLVESGRPAARERAAMVAGMLAEYDFEHVYDDLVDSWAGHARRDYRQAAALAAVATAHVPGIRSNLSGRVHRWVARGSAYKRDSAARAYAEGLGRLDPYRALYDLSLVAHDRMQRRNGVIAQAVAVTYAGTSARVALQALRGWTASDQESVRVHGARALVVLAGWSAGGEWADWPELLARVADGSVEVADVARLWAPALLLPGTAFQAWRLLGYWISRVDAKPALAEYLDLLFATLCADERLRARTRHQLVHVWCPQMPRNPFLDRIEAILEGT